ncbi:MAG: hypothetical protein ACJ790_10170 [Myxococcaceae bacterium]
MTRPLFVSLLLLATAAVAQEGYEDRLVSWALQETHRELDPAPEGKRITEVLVVSEDIVAPSDPYPRIVNIVHVRTKPDVIQRELLLHEGDTFDAGRAAESERNLRGLGIFAIARVVAVKSPDGVALLAVTKDLWSIRFESQFSLVGSVLQFVRVRPRESNFLGRNKVVSLEFQYRRDTLSFGELYEDRRVFGSDLALSQSAAVIFNRGTKVAEGSRGTLAFGLPLRTLDQPWGFDVSGSWSIQRSRLYSGADILEVPFDDTDETIPFVYDARVLSALARVTNQSGASFKRQWSLGAGAYQREYHPPWALPSPEREYFTTTYLPRSENAVYLYGAYRLFQPDFIVMHNVYTFALSEDVQLGPSVFAEARYATPVLGSPTHFLEAGLRARYRHYFADNLATATASGSARYSPGGDPVIGKDFVDKRLTLQLEEVTPPIGIGRIVGRALWIRREDPLSVPFLQLGGDSGLRGLPAEALRGRNELLFNLEYRSRPIELFTLHTGFVLFYDAGSAYNRSPNVIHTVGIGLRALFPQFDVQTLRIDFGWAINGPATALLDHFSATFGQVTDERPANLDAPLD